MKIKVTYTKFNVTVPRLVAQVYQVAPFGIPSGITNDVLTAAGSMIVATAASTPSETGAPSADGQVWTSNLALPKKGAWAAQSGGGGTADMVNKSGATVTAGSVVIFDAGNDSGFTTTTVLQDRRVVGVLAEDISNNSTGKVAVGARTATVKVTGNVSRGMWLIASATAGYAQAGGYTKPLGSLGIALTQYTGGATGTVLALIVVDHYLGASASKGYSIGGVNNTPAAVTTAQVLTMASETVAIVAGAALGGARAGITEMGTTDKGIMQGGTNTSSATGGQVTAYKVVYSTDVTSAISSANLPAARTAGGTVSAPLAGYYAGGIDTGFAVQAAAYKTPWSTETAAAQASANLSGNRCYVGHNTYSTTNGYMATGLNTTVYWSGGTVTTTDRLVISTETTGALGSAAVSAARISPAGTMNTTQVYWSGGITTTPTLSTTTDKMPFSTETTAAVGGAALSAARRYPSGNSGTSGYVLGGSTTTAGNLYDIPPSTPVATTDKLNFSSDTMAAASGANLVTALSAMASMTAPQGEP